MATISPVTRQGCLFPGLYNPLGNQTDQSQITQIIPQSSVWTWLTTALCPCSHWSSAHMHWNWYSWSRNSQSDQTEFPFRGARGRELPSQLLKNGCMCFFHCIFLPALMETGAAQPLDEPAEPGIWQPWLVSGIWEEHQLKKMRG